MSGPGADTRPVSWLSEVVRAGRVRKTGPVRFAAFDLDGNGRGRLEGGQRGQSLIDAHFEVWSLGSACAWWMLWPAGNLLSSGPCRDQHPPIGEIVGLGAAARFDHPGSASRLAGSHLFLVHGPCMCATFAISQDLYIPVHASCPGSSSASASYQNCGHSQAWAAGATTVPACPS